MATAPPRSSAASVREQKLARVIDREVAPVWHNRFARLLLRELPVTSGTFALDIHSGPGHTTAELLQRLDESSRVVALGRDPWLMQVSKTRVRPEWKRRVYFKTGDMDDVPGMAEDTYDLTIANLVLGEQVVDWQAALAELIRVTKPSGHVLATLPMYGTWDEVEDLFEELLRDEGMRAEVVTLQKLRRRRPKPGHLVTGLRDLGIREADVVVEHERFELLFRSGREFLFAPVIEHGPLRLWKAIIGRAEKPQALFWRFKEAIDTYYMGRVLSVGVVAGVIRVRIPSLSKPRHFAAEYWGRYPTLARLWGAPGATAEPAEDEDFDLDIDTDDEDEDEIGTPAPIADEPSPSDLAELQFTDSELGLADLPAVEDAGFSEDPFNGLLEELDAEAAAAAEIAAEDAAEARRQAPATAAAGKATTLGALGDNSPSGLRALPRKPGESGASPLPVPAPGKPALPGNSGGRVVLPGMPPRTAPLPPKTGGVPTVEPKQSPIVAAEDELDVDEFDELDDVTPEPIRPAPFEGSSGVRKLPPPPPVGPPKKQ